MRYDLNFIKDFEIQKTINNFIDSLVSVKDKKMIYCTDFMNPKEIEYAVNILNSNKDIDYIISEVPFKSEKSVILMWDSYYYDKNYIEVLDYIKLVKIDTKIKINHRDVLGSILNLGINRNKIGDIFTNDGNFYVCATSSMAKFILLNLRKIKNFNVEISLIDNNIEKDALKFETYNKIINSDRIDVIVSEMINVSRSSSQSIIRQKKVKLNYETIDSVSKSVAENSIISIRGHGRFQFIKFLGKTKKDKYRIEYIKFV